jgi:hypothetical protein
MLRQMWPPARIAPGSRGYSELIGYAVPLPAIRVALHASVQSSLY